MLVNLLIGLAIAVSLPAVVLGCECLLSLLPLRRDGRAERGERPPLVILVPAHDEQVGIEETIDALLPQLGADDRLIVIADNCSDETAAIARRLGAEVLERVDKLRRGKGYAIRYALDQLAAVPPEVVVCIDADCRPLPGCVERIARSCYSTGRPVQAAYLMKPPADASPGTYISAFAVLVKNYVRPRGLQRLGMPCLITGSGVAYPWRVLQQVLHPESHIVEDMRYSVDLALADRAPLPCMEAFIESTLPGRQEAARTQRIRWEHGHLSVMLSEGPRLFWGAVIQRSSGMLALWLDLMVPPLSLLFFLLAVTGGALLVVGRSIPVETAWGVLLVGVGVCVAGLTATWWCYGRRVLPPQMLPRVPLYILGKLSIYTKFLTSPEKSWVRTTRDAASRDPAAGTSGPHFHVATSTVEKSSNAE